MCSVVKYFLDQMQASEMVLTFNTHDDVKDGNPYGIVSKHAYWLRQLREDEATIVDLREHNQREIRVPLNELVKYLFFIEGATL